MGYKSIYTLDEIKEYLSKIIVVALDFETAPDEKYLLRRNIRRMETRTKERINSTS